jgi:nicotinamide-nucleotide amidase
MNPTNTLVAALAETLKQQGAQMACAESCTGGLVAGACTDLAGSSDWFERSVVSYSNQAKTDLLGVPAPLIEAHGAVSEQVARAMVQGLLERSPAHYALAVTGIAGPGGGSPGKPVGTVWFAWGRRGHGIDTFAQRQHFDGDRAAVRAASVRFALEGLLQLARGRLG